MKTKIIYEDQHILICYKPAGLATQTAKIGQPDMVSELKNYLAAKQRQTIQQQVQRQAAQQQAGQPQATFSRAVRQDTGAAGKSSQPYLGVIHRLDQPVEGLLVFAKDSKTAAKLSASLSQGILNKQYYAVVCGQPGTEKAELVDYLIKDPSTGSARVVSEPPQKSGKPKSGRQNGEKQGIDGQKPQKAILQYRVLKQELCTSPALTLLDIHIDTGRFHQIRAQMAHAGLPLIGDSRYGSEASLQLSRELRVRNVALCAYRIELMHPVTNKKMEFQIEPEGEIFKLEALF